MKDIVKILEESGLTISPEQREAITTAVAENYRTIADYQKQAKKLETAADEHAATRKQLEAATEALEKFKDMDPEKIQSELEQYRKAAEDARKEAEREIMRRDQRDFLRSRFDELGIQNDRIRKSLADDIMGDDGLKWKDGGFYGLDDYLTKVNEKEHLYKTAEEKELEEKQAAARSKLPTFTDRSRGKDTGDGEKKDIPVIW